MRAAGTIRRPGITRPVGWIAAAVMIVAAFGLIGLLVDAFAPAPQGPALSSYATTPDGVAAWAELLQRQGHRVTQLRNASAIETLDPDATLVVLGASSLSGAMEHQISVFARAGGWVLAAGGDTEALAARLLGRSSRVPLPIVRPLGRGRIEALADPKPLENGLLGAGDNAEHALELAGATQRPVVFDEGIHGFGQASGLAALPGRWWLAIVGLALAAAAGALARGRRLGGPDPLEVAGLTARTAYVDAMAATLARTGDLDTLTDSARSAAAEERAFERSLG
jgi:hypothetical protein